MPVRHVAVLGGGISGLTTAFYLAKHLPRTARITLLEKSNRVGGWMRSFPIEDSRIALEAGPRTFKGTSLPNAVVHLIHDLNLSSHLITAPSASAAGLFRYLWLEEDQQLTLIPPTPLHWLFSSKLRPFLFTMVSEFWKAANRPDDLEMDDESLDAFLSRRFSPEMARLFGSSLIHGVYAADSRKLSLQSAFPLLRHAERDGKGGIWRGLPTALEKRKEANVIRTKMTAFPGAETPTETLARLGSPTAFTFEGGMEMVPRTLEARLMEKRNVEMRVGVGCVGMEKGDGDFKLSLTDGSTIEPSHVVSTLPLPALHDIIAPSQAFASNPISALTTPQQFTSVQVLNLVFPPSPTRLHPEGFGFLVPRPRNGYPTSPTTEDGERLTNLLGCVFDSSVDTEHDHTTQSTIITMMMGGPFGLPSGADESGSTTLSADHLQIYLNTLQHHLGPSYPLPSPSLHALHTNLNCIPTYAPGHASLTREVLGGLKAGPWGKNLQVIGTSVGGVGLSDCVVGGVGAAWRLCQAES